MSFLKVINIQNPSNANASIIINSAGNVGIGSSSPVVALDVTGTTNISGNLNVLGTTALSNPSISGNINTTGTLTVGGNLSVGGINAQISSSNTNLAGNLTVGSNLVVNGANTFISSSNATVTGNLNIVTGNLNLTGLGQRITGDYSNATLVSRLAFQTNTANATTGIYALPNGTGVAASWQATNNSDPTNASKILIATNGSTDVQLVSGINGSGTYLPLTFYTGGSERVRVTTAGFVGIGVTSIGALLQVGGTAWFGSSTTGAIGILTPDPTSGANGFNIAASYATGGYGPLSFTTSATERMRISGSGNLLVGTTAVPSSGSSTLVINGQGTNAGGVEYVNQNNGGGNVQALSAGGLQWGTFTGSVGSETYAARLTLGATGILSTYYTSSTGLTTWNTAQNVIGGLHFATNSGTSTSAKAEAAITFGYANSLTNAQAGIYVTNDTSSGTWMALATTDNYTTGPQIGLSITNTGGVSVPRTWLTVPNQPAWHAYYTGTADLAITIGTTTFTYNIASVNNGANYSTSSGRFTAPVAGTYYVYAQVQYAAIVAPSFTGLYITKNGSLYVDGYTQNTGYSEPGVRATITLAAGDYLQVVANYSVSASASVIQLSAGTRNYFGGYLIG